jgi:hypothetical protein
VISVGDFRWWSILSKSSIYYFLLSPRKIVT